MNYYIKHVSEVPGAPHINDIIGSPIEDNLACTIVIKSIFNPKLILINHNVLREALLANPKETERLLGVIVKDVNDEEVIRKTTVNEIKPKTKKQKGITLNNAIQQNINEWD